MRCPSDLWQADGLASYPWLPQDECSTHWTKMSGVAEKTEDSTLPTSTSTSILICRWSLHPTLFPEVSQQTCRWSLHPEDRGQKKDQQEERRIALPSWSHKCSTMIVSLFMYECTAAFLLRFCLFYSLITMNKSVRFRSYSAHNVYLLASREVYGLLDYCIFAQGKCVDY